MAKRARKTTNKALVDPGLKRRWEVAIERYRGSRTQEAAGWDERYEALGEIIEEELYLAGGFKTVRDFLKAEAPDQDERSVKRAIRVARNFDPDDEMKHGITKLDLLLDYLEAAGGAPVAPAKIRLDRQRVTVRRDKKERKLPFAQVTAAELAAAAREAKTGGRKLAPPAVKALLAALKRAKLGGVAVSQRGERITLSNVALEDVNRLGKSLAAAKLPA